MFPCICLFTKLHVTATTYSVLILFASPKYSNCVNFTKNALFASFGIADSNLNMEYCRVYFSLVPRFYIIVLQDEIIVNIHVVLNNRLSCEGS